MFSSSDQLVREKKHPKPGEQSHHGRVPTLTDHSTLFLLHRRRDLESTRPGRPRWWQFWRR